MPPGFGDSLTHAPTFFGEDRRRGVLLVDFRDPSHGNSVTTVPYVTGDGRATWSEEAPLAARTDGEISGADAAGDVWAITDRQAYPSTDGGVHWTSVPSPPRPAAANPRALDVVGAHAWLLAQTGPSTAALWSTDGTAWTQLPATLRG